MTPGAPSVAVIGPGRAGIALAAALRRGGRRLTGVVGRRRSTAARASRLLGGATGTTDVAGAVEAAGAILLCVPDRAVASTAASLARLPLTGKVVLHVSGALDLSCLAPTRAAGASVGSLHPLVSFPEPRRGAALPPGVACAVDGDPRALAVARGLVRAIRGTSFRLDSSCRPAYHAAATLAAGGVVALLDAALAIAARGARLGPARARAAFLLLARSALVQVERSGTRRALTGPIARGERDTVRRHLAALAREGADVLALYRAVALRGLAMSGGGRRGAPRAAGLRRLLDPARGPSGVPSSPAD